MEELRRHIRNYLLENFLYQEERISNKEAAEEVTNRQNFVGSHTYGEDLGGLGKMYVAYSYGEEHPLYLWDGETDSWYYNHNDYILPDGTANVWTQKHLKDLRPDAPVQNRPALYLKKKIDKFKNKHGITTTVHTDLKPGEK